MRYVASTLFFVLLILSSWHNPMIASGEQFAPMPGGPVAVSKIRPFLKTTPDWATGVALCRKVVNGDAKAAKEFKNSGLTYVPQFQSISSNHPELLDAYWRNNNWIEAMQSWEFAFVCSTPSEILELYKKLMRRFQSSDLQLSRAIIYAHFYGDVESKNKLIDLNKDSKWVQAAIGFCGEIELKSAVEKIMAVMGDIQVSENLEITFNPALLKPESSRKTLSSFEDFKSEFEDVAGSGSIGVLHSIPVHWTLGRLAERLGALLSDINEKPYVEKTLVAVEELVTDNRIGDWHLSAARVAFNMGNGADANSLSADANKCAGNTIGPVLGIHILFRTPQYQWFTRGVNATTAFYTMPDIAFCRRNYLARCFDTKEPMIARLACRSVFVLSGDNLSTYSDIARALMLFWHKPELSKEFAEALKKTKHESLVKIASAVESNDKAFLQNPERKNLNLTLAQKQTLLSVFCDSKELEVNGGIEATYWLNEAMFFAGARNIMAAEDAFWKAIRAAEPEKPSLDINPVILEYFTFIWNAYSKEQRDQRFEEVAKTDKKLSDKVKLILSQQSSKELDVEKNAIGLSASLTSKQENLPIKLREEIEKNPKKWGGEGYAQLAENAMNEREFTKRKKYIEAARRAAPLNKFFHELQGPDHEYLGTMTAANWDHAARHVFALQQIQPYDLSSIGAIITMNFRNGETTHTLKARSLAMATRHTSRNTGRGYTMAFPYVPDGRSVIQPMWKRVVSAAPEMYTEKVLEDMRVQFTNIKRGWKSKHQISSILSMRGMVPTHCLEAIKAYTFQSRMNDVSYLLDQSYQVCYLQPDTAIAYVKKADGIGVSNYGRFVGTQSLCYAHSYKGEWSKIKSRYKEMRGGRSGMPRYLDIFLTAGLTAGNNHKEAADAIETIAEFDLTENSNIFHYQWRRLHMLAGKHDAIADLELPENGRGYLEDGTEYSTLFHEARALLDNGKFEELVGRTDPYLNFHAQADLGVFLDATILKAVAMKAAGKELPRNGKKLLQVIDPKISDVLLSSPTILDCKVLAMLSGQQPIGEIGAIGNYNLWHGSVYGERAAGWRATQRITFLENQARDRFIRGVLKWLQDDEAGAKAMLNQCIEHDQRASYEYHVAEWLLANTLKSEKGK